jgi:hypothetical protein
MMFPCPFAPDFLVLTEPAELDGVAVLGFRLGGASSSEKDSQASSWTVTVEKELLATDDTENCGSASSYQSSLPRP